ncbi:hypothetical protein AM587_10011447 [Phytophthora nicotianae]|uniref:Uncharacterized protein n=1 Tax=Phytophthora nicotianae TaxID=4792 RepID=A0A0W8D5N2_PHYNI|nr:hypothetical protein AM587_10011447 [Phytophthora nicotianae]
MMNMLEATDAAEFATKGVKAPLWSGAAYSHAISKSMRAMMTSSRLRPGSLQIAANPDTLFADAVARKDKEKMMDALAKDPGILRRSDGNGRTPLHILCENSCVTVQALAVFATSLGDLTLVQDSNGNLPLHHLCRNSSCEIGLIKKLSSDVFAYTTINEEGQTPLHCLVTADGPLNQAVLQHLIAGFPSTALMRDLMGRTILHWICENHALDAGIIQMLLTSVADAASLPDVNENVTRELLHLVLEAYPAGVYALAKNDLSPLHSLCSNESCNTDILTEFFSFDKDNSLCAKPDAVRSYYYTLLFSGSISCVFILVIQFGATALHLLCMNETISTELLRTMLLMCSEDSFTPDAHGRSPLHYLCMNHAVSSEMFWLFFDRGHDLPRQADKDERTPLHYLCGNAKVTPRLIELLFDSWPSAALVADRDFKLPVQYLVDNPASSSEIASVLICGPASYRHRYEFLNVNGQCVCFTQGTELVYAQSNMATDSNTGTKVLVNFYSSEASVNHEQKLLCRLKIAAEVRADHVNYSPTVHETFENAKRRLTLCNMHVAPEDHNGAFVNSSSDAVITLDYALVMEAPLYTLEGLKAEKLIDTEAIRAITTEVANCLLFWHCEARMVHGNIMLQNIGQFEDRGLCLYSLSTSRELYQQRSIGSHAIALSSCPPEAAKSFVAKEDFLPTEASDMWQFGCLVYVLPLIAEIAPEFRLLLQRTLVINPNYRWDIDRLLLLEDGSPLFLFVTSDTSSHDFVGKTLQQKTEDALAEGSKGSRSEKHAQEQLEFMKKEQSLLRHTLLSTKSQLRDVDQARTDLQLKMEELQIQMTSEVQQRKEAQLEAQLLARNHQSMTLQLHTTVQMLLNLVPLARKWANSSPSSAVAATEFTSLDTRKKANAPPLDNPNDSESKPCNETEYPDTAMA